MVGNSEPKVLRCYTGPPPSPDDSLLAARQRYEHAVGAVAFSKDSALLAAALHNGTIELWRVSDAVKSLVLNPGQQVRALAFREDRLLASASSDGTLRLWDTTKGVELTALAANERFSCLVFRSNGQLAAVECQAGNAEVFEVMP